MSGIFELPSVMALVGYSAIAAAATSSLGRNLRTKVGISEQK